MDDMEANIISETENFIIWRNDDDEDGVTYHVELGGVTLHLSAEEWDELVVLFKSLD